MSCEEAMEDAKLSLARLMAMHEQIMELHRQAWLSERSRIRLWSLNMEERTIHLQWVRLEDAALAASQEHQ